MTKSYQPSSGTEGDYFMAEFCDRCKHNTWDPDKSEGGCMILLNTMCYDIKDKEYPKEWIYDDNNKPTCTKFEFNSD